MAQIGVITVGNNPSSVAYDATGTYAYVANAGDGTVSVIDTTGGSGFGGVTAVVTVGGNPQIIAVGDDDRIYVTNTNGTVSVINTQDNTMAGSITVSGTPVGIAFNGANSSIYVMSPTGQVVSIRTV